MSSTLRKELYNKTGVAVVADDLDDANFENGARGIEVKEIDFIAVLKILNRTAGDVDGIIEHSFDGTYWETIATFSTLSADGIDLQEISAFVLPKVRAKITKTNAAVCDIEVYLYHSRQR